MHCGIVYYTSNIFIFLVGEHTITYKQTYEPKGKVDEGKKKSQDISANPGGE